LGEAAVDGNGAGQVGVVVGVIGGDVEQQEIAVAAGLIVVDVVQDAGVGAGGDDGVVGEGAALTDEFVGELGLDLMFRDPGLNEAADAFEAGAGDGAGLRSSSTSAVASPMRRRCMRRARRW
jgi:hypothetical protein